MDLTATLSRLGKIQTELLFLVQEVRTISDELEDVAKQNPTFEAFLDAEEVAKILGVDKAFVYTQARNRKIPSVKLGKYRQTLFAAPDKKMAGSGLFKIGANANSRLRTKCLPFGNRII